MRRSHAPGRLSLGTAGALMLTASVLTDAAGPATRLPVPCAAGTCNSYNVGTGNSTPISGFVTSGQASETQKGNTLTVKQASSQTILNWASFNIGADGKVVFQQPSSTAIALNKIYQASPSSIFGELTANGQIYLINPNGIIFGSTASVNVGSLLASSLSLAQGDSELSSGILAPAAAQEPALASDGRIYVTDSAGNVVPDANGNPQPVQVVVQPGAQLTTADSGRLLLAGQN